MSSSDSIKVAGKKLSLADVPGWEFESRPGGWMIASRKRPNGTIERTRVMLSLVRGKVAWSAEGRLFQGEWLVTGRGAGASTAGDADLVAQFPGKVRKVLVADGARVSEGDPLVLVEAMKMEFAVKAPANGRVVRVLVKESQQLSPGDRFVEFEESEVANGGK